MPPALSLGRQQQCLRQTSTNMITRTSPSTNMGRGAYDTTGVQKPPPKPKPR
ncbi:hypothetical protein PVAG01_00201 [Phlyctema vagabunda]|uniref:Uncharacterized protein n=1 Tax=Phlyctema vagabunda TaxID=108571 RepID=A0ABR4PTJ5_9HELO